MSELKLCPTPRTDAARNKAFLEYQVLYPGKRARPVNDLDMAEVECELIATQLALKEAGEALQGAEFGMTLTNSKTLKAHIDLVNKSLSNPFVKKAMVGK